MSIRVGFLGAGLIARYHAMQLAMSDEANRIAVVFDTDADRAADFARTTGASVAADADAVVAASDVVFVCTWTAAHIDGVRRCAEAGRPVFCEKPLAVDLASAQELTDIVTAAGVINMVGLVLRSSPALVTLREMVRDPASGRVMSIVFRDDQYLPTQGMYGSTWRGDVDKAGSGVLLEHSIHDLDLLEWLVAPIESVSAMSSNFHGIDGIEDSVTAVVRFNGGATASLCSVWHDVLARPSQRRIEVLCENAVVTLEGDVFGPVRSQRDDEDLTVADDDLIAWLRQRDVPLLSVETQFLAEARTRVYADPSRRLHPDVHDALRAHVVADAIYRSASQGGGVIDLRSASQADRT